MSEALADLEKGLSFEKTIDKWSNDPVMRAKHGVSDFFPITDRSPIGEIASLMEIGQRYGPVQVPQGVVYFELLTRAVFCRFFRLTLRLKPGESLQRKRCHGYDLHCRAARASGDAGGGSGDPPYFGR